MSPYKFEKAQHPEDPKIHIEVYAPAWYKKGQHRYKDLYSSKIILSKRNDESDYFKPYLEKLILRLFHERKIRTLSLITIIPKSDGKLSPTLVKLGKWICMEFGGVFDELFVKQSSPRKNKTAGNFLDRFKRAKEDFSLIRKLEKKEKYILILDDQKTTGNTLLVCTKLLKDSGCQEVYCISLSINRNIDRFGE